MGEPHVPGAGDGTLDLCCGESITLRELDMGMRAVECDCGATHTVVMDVHPVSRWIPEEVESTLLAAVETADEHDRFNTIHLMGLFQEEFPDRSSVADVSTNDALGWRLVWILEDEPRRVHEIIVELLVELMVHAMSHAEDEELRTTFDTHLDSFDVSAFVDAYRAERNVDTRRQPRE